MSIDAINFKSFDKNLWGGCTPPNPPAKRNLDSSETKLFWKHHFVTDVGYQCWKYLYNGMF